MNLLSEIMVKEAFAADYLTTQGGSIVSSLMPIALIMVVFYFLLLRPQQKKMKEHQAMIAALQKGAVVVFGGGILGTVVKADDPKIVLIEIAQDIKIKVRKDSVTELVQDDTAQSPHIQNKKAPSKKSAKAVQK